MADFSFATITDYAEAYRGARITPLTVAERFLELLSHSEALLPPLRLFIAQYPEDLLDQARRSTARHLAGRALGPLDGVPVAVKDELDQAGYPTTVGTSFIGRDRATTDATVVARLRAAGALLVGKTNMHEVGIGVTGINPHHGTARNPYRMDRVTGGSSSGSAAVVACGLCPVAIGADGGGSIRIPAALCGIAGIKPTFGRVSERGAWPLCWSVAHVGPIAASLHDAATVLDLIAGPDAGDPNTLGQPPLDLREIHAPLAGVRLGWCERWSAQATPAVDRICRSAIDHLVQAGARVEAIELEHLELIAPVQYITIGTEMAASQHELRREHQQDYGADARLLLEVASRVTAVDYLRAQRLRTLIAQDFARALERVDAIVTPTTATPAPPLREAALRDGESDEQVLEDLTAFSFAANLTGLPAVTVTAGYDEGILPVGLQIMGRHWQEAILLRLGIAVEDRVRRQAPCILLEPLRHAAGA